MTLPVISPAEARKLVAGGARLIDIRSADEHARARIPGSENRPIDAIGRVGDAPAVVYHCRSGMRTSANATRLAAASDCPAYLLEGGLDAWRAAGLPLAENRKAPLEIMRQVQITAGALVVLGVVLGFLFSPAFLGLSAFVGAGLMFAGTTGWCGMARLLAVMPWNRRSAA
ncbi:rhodanese family protein [Novosphingobium sp.]|uniref:rhodanese family protein n=1 Tax=Novosphingobium sp. TaxID=1874826 RepID=UPI001DFDBCBA|nr:rhodanese family protein [Novosphingobium sp.]MBX9664498.1 rhodanese family protein [Novosphingobium sp.]